MLWGGRALQKHTMHMCQLAGHSRAVLSGHPGAAGALTMAMLWPGETFAAAAGAAGASARSMDACCSSIEGSALTGAWITDCAHRNAHYAHMFLTLPFEHFLLQQALQPPGTPLELVPWWWGMEGCEGSVVRGGQAACKVVVYTRAAAACVASGPQPSLPSPNPSGMYAPAHSPTAHMRTDFRHTAAGEGEGLGAGTETEREGGGEGEGEGEGLLDAIRSAMS